MKRNIVTFTSIFLSFVVLGSGSICGLFGNSGDSPTRVSPPTVILTPTPRPAPILEVNSSSPAGARVEINPRENSRGPIPGTGRYLGVTPLTVKLLLSDFIYTPDRKYITFTVLVSKHGYFSKYEHFDTYVGNGPATPNDHYSFEPFTLDPCGQYGPDCGGV